MAASRKRKADREPTEEPELSKKKKVSKDVGPGLPNLGNTCFFNATLQNLAYTNGLLSLLSKQETEERTYDVQCKSQVFTVSVGYGDRPLTTAFCNFLQVFNKRNPRMIELTMRELYAKIEERYERFKDNAQQDSAELLRCLLDGIRKEEIKAIKEEVDKKFHTETDDEIVDVEKKLLLKEANRAVLKLKTPIDELFGGELLNTVICRECLTPTQLVEPFVDISVPIPDEWDDCFEPRNYSDTNKAENPKLLQELLNDFSPQMCTKLTTDPLSGKMNDLDQCLAEYTSLDVLDEDNKFICKECNEDRKVNNDDCVECLVSKQLLFHSLPQILILHIKRFHLGQQVTKNNRHIDFPLDLDLAPFCTKNCQEYCVNGKIMYSLYGVVEHSGTLHSGHYMAKVRKLVQGGSESGSDKSVASSHGEVHKLSIPEHGHWCHASDAYTREATVDEVHSSHAYLLFYERTCLPKMESNN